MKTCRRIPALSALALGLSVLVLPVSAEEPRASDGAVGDRFGSSVSLYGSSGLVGALLDDDKGSDSGSAYLFRNLDTATGIVTESVKLTASDGAVGDRFGSSVSLSGSTGLVGAYADDDKGGNSGSAYLFLGLDSAAGTVNEAVKITASNGAAGDNFGHSVSLDGDRFLVGVRMATAWP